MNERENLNVEMQNRIDNSFTFYHKCKRCGEVKTSSEMMKKCKGVGYTNFCKSCVTKKMLEVRKEKSRNNSFKNIEQSIQKSYEGFVVQQIVEVRCPHCNEVVRKIVKDHKL